MKVHHPNKYFQFETHAFIKDRKLKITVRGRNRNYYKKKSTLKPSIKCTENYIGLFQIKKFPTGCFDINLD